MGLGSQGTSKDKRKGEARNGKAERFNDDQFITYELDKASASACKSWGVSADSLLQSVLELNDLGYSFTLKWDTWGDCYGVFLRQTDETGPNKGFILTGRGSTPEKALKQVLYKHFEVMGGDWEQFAVVRRGVEIDD